MSINAAVAADITNEVPKRAFVPHVPSSLPDWTPVMVEYNVVNITGGRDKTTHSASSVTFQGHTFVELDKNAGWFLKSVGGSKARKGDLKSVEVIALLRALFYKKVDEIELSPTAVAGCNEGESQGVSDSIDADTEFDPMDALADIDDIAKCLDQLTPPKNTGTVRKNRHWGVRSTARSVVQKLTVPVRPRCAGGDDSETVDIWLYKMPVHKITNKKIRLAIRCDCVEWLVAYASDEYTCEGVEAWSPESTPNLQANCTTVADLHVAYNVDSRSWVATFVAGPNAGLTKRIAVNDISKDMWTRLNHTEFYAATGLEKKNAARECMVKWCADIAQNSSDDSQWSMDDFKTPPRRDKRRRHADEEYGDANDAAVAE